MPTVAGSPIYGESQQAFREKVTGKSEDPMKNSPAAKIGRAVGTGFAFGKKALGAGAQAARRANTPENRGKLRKLGGAIGGVLREAYSAPKTSKPRVPRKSRSSSGFGFGKSYSTGKLPGFKTFNARKVFRR